MKRDYYKTVTFPDGYTKTYFPRMSYTHHAEGDTTFNSKGQNLLGQRLPRKIKKWVRKELFDEPRWKPWWTGQNRRLTPVLPAGILGGPKNTKTKKKVRP